MSDATNDSDQQAHRDHQLSAHNRLKRLQDLIRTNLPAMLATRATSSFTLHEEPVPSEAVARIQMMVYPQDPFVGVAEIRRVSTTDVRPGLLNSRVQIEDSAGSAAQPDKDGNYLYAPGTIEFDQVNAFYYTTQTLRMYERYARRALPWAFPNPRISVNPHAGDQANAYYNEQERQLGFQTFTPGRGGERVSTAQSADIVSHEAGHAVLDGLRDLYNESFGLGTAAFHESFGDMTAMLVAMHDDSLLRRMLQWTDNDLHLDNFITAFAEQLTDTLRRENAETLVHTVYLRNAFNTFTAVPFDQMQYEPPKPEFTLGRQPHNYSRLFTGSFYDALTGIYDYLRKTQPPHIALSRARDIMGRLLVAGVESGPLGELNFYDMALAFLNADQLLYNGEYSSILSRVFTERGIGSTADFTAFLQTLKALPEIRLPETLNTSLASALFLEDTVLPVLKAQVSADAELIPLATYRNADGYVFMTYFSSRQMVLAGADFGEFNGVTLDLFGGLTLTFTPNNMLCGVTYRPVTDEDMRQTEVMIREYIREGLLIDGLRRAGSIPHGVLLSDLPGSGKLVKYPATVDVIGSKIDIAEYFRELRNQP